MPCGPVARPQGQRYAFRALFPAGRTAGARFRPGWTLHAGPAAAWRTTWWRHSRVQAVLGNRAGPEAAYGTFFE